MKNQKSKTKTIALDEIVEIGRQTPKRRQLLSEEDKQFLYKKYNHQDLKCCLYMHLQFAKHNLLISPMCNICGKELCYGLLKKQVQRNETQICCSYKCAAKQQQSTNLLKYGHVCSAHGPEQQKQKISTWIKHYGVDNPLKQLKVRNKIKITCKNKYGYENPGFLSNKSIKSTQSYEFEIIDYINNVKQVTTCMSDYSIIQPLQLDIYIPDLKLAIEVNGDYWHSIKKQFEKSKINRQILKTNLCEERGIRLIHIWEHEWLNNQDYCKYVIECYLSGKIPNISIYNGKLPRDYFQTLDFPDGKIEEPIIEKSGKFDVYKTGYIIL